MSNPSDARFRARPINVLTLSMIVCFVIKFLIVIAECKPSRPMLRGVTFRNWPYADRINDRYEGFIVDLMNMIAQKVGFEYRLYFSPDGKYGTEFNGNINGMIGEVFRNRADFAIADLTVTESRKRYVDFTDAFLENQLAAIIRRDDAIGLRTLEDLVTLNEINHRPDLPPKERRGLLTYGTYRTGATYYHLSKNKDPIAKKIYEWMVRNPDALVTSAKEGFDRVNAGRYAFIVESTFAEYLTGIYCNLTMLYDTRSLYPRKFAIALPKGSPYLDGFNKAIRELRSTGIIQRLRHKYWINRCGTRNDDNGAGDAHPSPSTSKPIQQAHPPSFSSTPSASQAAGSAKMDNNGKIDGQDDADNRNDHQPSPPPPQLSGHHHNHNNNNNNNNNNLNGKNNITANAIQFEWASHNHHNNGNPHPVDRNRQPHLNQPPPPPPLSPSLIHHRINYHHRNRMNHNHNEPHYPVAHPDYSDDNGVLLDDGVARSDNQPYYSGKGSRKRAQNSAISVQNGSTVGFVLAIVTLTTALGDLVLIR